MTDATKATLLLVTFLALLFVASLIAARVELG